MARDFARSDSVHAAYLYKTGASVPAQGTNLTVCAWINADLNNEAVMIVGRDESVDSNRVYQFRQSSGGKVEAVIFIGNSPIVATGTTTISTGAWHFVAIKHDGSNLYVYLDSATNDGSVAASGSLDADVVGISIGARATTSLGNSIDNAYDGRIAECAEWTRALTDAELAQLAKAYSPRFIPNGLNWYAPIIGRNDPELELIRGTALAVTTVSSGTANAAEHPMMIYPKRRQPFMLLGGGNATAALSGTAATSARGTQTPGISIGL